MNTISENRERSKNSCCNRDDEHNQCEQGEVEKLLTLISVTANFLPIHTLGPSQKSASAYTSVFQPICVPPPSSFIHEPLFWAELARVTSPQFLGHVYCKDGDLDESAFGDEDAVDDDAVRTGWVSGGVSSALT